MDMQITQTVTQAPGLGGMQVAAADPLTTEYLAFRLAGQEYAANILNVQEIRTYEQPTRMVGSADYMLGVHNLRGTIVPILDLRLRLGLPAVYDSQTVTVLLNLPAGTVGLVVDSVSDVVALAAEDIQPMPALNDGADTRVFQGLAGIQVGDATRTLVVMGVDGLLAAGGSLSPLS